MTSYVLGVDRPQAGSEVGPWREALQRVRAGDTALFRYALVLLALAAVFAALAMVDPRTLRGAVVWIKPMKFAVSIAVLALTTSFAASALAAPVRSGTTMGAIRWTVIALGSLELFYIALQAALGEASHYNRSDALHAALYTAMGVAAVALTATQPALAVLVARSAAERTPDALRAGLVVGLALTFVLGAGAGMTLGGGAAPSNAGGVPLLGWTFGQGDLRPAHFVGIHAGQALPALGAWLAARRVAGRRAALAIAAGAIAWTLLFTAAAAAAFVLPAGR